MSYNSNKKLGLYLRSPGAQLRQLFIVAPFPGILWKMQDLDSPENIIKNT